MRGDEGARKNRHKRGGEKEKRPERKKFGKWNRNRRKQGTKINREQKVIEKETKMRSEQTNAGRDENEGREQRVIRRGKGMERREENNRKW